MTTRSSQRRLSFPVRKSTRQRRTDSLSCLKEELLEQTDNSPLRRSRRNTSKLSLAQVPTSAEDQNDNIHSKHQSPVKASDPVKHATPEKKSKWRNQPAESESGSSPGKRKSDSEDLTSPPTPPKSPSISAPDVSKIPSTQKNRNITAVSLLSPKKSKVLPQVFNQNLPKKQEHASPPSSTASPLRSPAKRKLSENVPPPPTPPKSPFTSRNQPVSAPPVLSPKRHQENVISSSKKTLYQASPVPSPRKLFLDENIESFIPKSPKKPAGSLHLSKPNDKPYQSTKQLLHTAKPDLLVGRDKEVSEIKGFLKTHLEKQSAGSFYISGAPGTGKTAALLHIIDDFKTQFSCAIGYINCMTVKDAVSVYRKLYTELSGKTSTSSRTAKDLEKLVTTCKDSLILVLDEIDQLDSKSQEVLYRIFEWPYLMDSKLILIGIANALDLTDRILPRLHAKPHCRPKLLHFAPYTHEQIIAIITNRLSQCKNGDAVIESSAIQFCARKVSAVAGDMRKALDACRRAVELVESEICSQQVLRVADCNSPTKSQPSMRKIGIPHISKVLSEVYGSSAQVQQSEGVPLQQKLVVCTLLLMIKSGKLKEVQLGKVYESYCKVSRKQQIAPVDQSEFHSLCVLLEARGIIGMKKAKDTRSIKLTLRQDEKELEQTLQDRVLVSSILKEGLPK